MDLLINPHKRKNGIVNRRPGTICCSDAQDFIGGRSCTLPTIDIIAVRENGLYGDVDGISRAA
jgi:hypothetical protein